MLEFVGREAVVAEELVALWVRTEVTNTLVCVFGAFLWFEGWLAAWTAGA